MVAGIVVLYADAPDPAVTTSEPDVSPGVSGVSEKTDTVRLWPGLSENTGGSCRLNGTKRCVATRHGTAPFVPEDDAISPKMTPVQVPATGSTTSTLPKLPTPWGSEWAASRP